MMRQARLIASWGDNVYVKMPVTDTAGRLHRRRHPRALGRRRPPQRHRADDRSRRSRPSPTRPRAARATSSRSSPAGSPTPAATRCRSWPRRSQVARPTTRSSSCSGPARARCSTSARPSEVGVHIITVTPDLLAKLTGFGKDLDEFSLETVQMFHDDAAGGGVHAVTDATTRPARTPTAPTRTTGTTTGTRTARPPRATRPTTTATRWSSSCSAAAARGDACSTSAAARASSPSTPAHVPATSVWGVEYSAEGVAAAAAGRRARRRAGARSAQLDLLAAGDPLADRQPPATSRRLLRGPRARRRPDRADAQRRGTARARAPGRRHRAGRPAVGVRPAHRPLPALHRADAARRCSPRPDYDVDRVLRAGFPFFNLYKLAVIARGAEARSRTSQSRTPGTEASGSRRR